MTLLHVLSWSMNVDVRLRNRRNHLFVAPVMGELKAQRGL